MTHFPSDVAIGEEGRLYCVCRGEGTAEIRRFNWDDEDLGTIGGPGSGDAQFTWPIGIVRDRDENLLVSDEALHRVSIFSRDGTFLSKWGQHGKGDGQLDRPSGIALDQEENVYLADTLNHRVQKFSKDGKFMGKWGSYGDGEGQLNMPWGIAVDELGDVYVTDWRNDRLQKFAPDGRFLLKLGRSGGAAGQFNRPSGVAVDSDGDIYVADWGNNRVQQFDATGRYVDQFIGDATLGKAARTYVMANQVTLRMREMASLEPSKRLRSPTSVKVDRQGRLYITDYSSHRIQVYKKEAYPLTPEQIAPELRSPSLYTA